MADAAGPGLQWFVIDAIPMSQIDITGLYALRDLRERLEARGTALILAGRKTEFLIWLREAGLYRPEHDRWIFPTLRQALKALPTRDAPNWAPSRRSRVTLSCHRVFPPRGVKVRPCWRDWTMKRSRFSEGQIIGILREHEAGARPAELARKHWISESNVVQLEGQNCRRRSGLISGSEDIKLRRSAGFHLIRNDRSKHVEPEPD